MNFDLSEIATKYAAVLSVLTFLVGLLIGNWQAIGRDKRLEFNSMTNAKYVDLVDQIKSIEHGRLSRGVGDFLLVEPHIRFYRRESFRRAFREYEAAHHGISIPDDTNGSASLDPVKLKHLGSCAKRLVKFLQPR